MKNIIFYLPLLFLFAALQNGKTQKYDYKWVMGHNGGTLIDFDNSPPTFDFIGNVQNTMGDVNVSMSDAGGELIFYTNGCDVFNREHGVMENGGGLNPGGLEACSGALDSYTLSQGGIAVPRPGSGTEYYIFHQRGVMVFEPSFDIYSDQLLYTVVDMEGDGGLGRVTEKNQLVLEDTLGSGDLTAIRHENGEDWWVVLTKRRSDKYFKVLLTAEGVEVVGEQSIGQVTLIGGDGGGEALFTPDGEKYVRYYTENGIFLFDFDRGTGELSNFEHVPVEGDSAFGGGAAVSPNSRYLYISGETKFWQFDLWAADIASTQVLLGEYDGFMSPFATTFRYCQLAPDCKIYCTSHSASNVLHVVHRPDEPGPDSGFEQHGVQLATGNYSMPNYPNYRLGTGQPVCSPVSSVSGARPPGREVSVFPNPANGEVTVELFLPLSGAAGWVLYDSFGRTVLKKELAMGQAEHVFPLAGLAPGLYFWEVRGEGGRLDNGKLIIGKNN